MKDAYLLQGGVSFMRWGLSLGGGSLRGAAHIGAIKVLDRNGLKPLAIAGTSAGAIVAALYASGLSGIEMENWALALTRVKVFDKAISACQYPLVLSKIVADVAGLNPSWHLPLGLFRGEFIAKQISLYTLNRRFSDLEIKTAINAVDLDTAEEVVFTNAKVAQTKKDCTTDAYLWEAVRASISLPGIFTPFVWQNRRLVDGGLAALNPAKIVKRMGLPFVLAIDVSLDATASASPDNFFEVLLRSYDIANYRKNKEELRLFADYTVEAGYLGVNLKEFSKIKDCIAYGEKTMENALKQLGISTLKY